MNSVQGTVSQNSDGVKYAMGSENGLLSCNRVRVCVN
jgi:hypothetical protein